MVALDVVFFEQLVEQDHTGDLLFVAAATAGSGLWTANALYVIWVFSQIGINNVNASFRIRAVHGSGPPTEFEGSEYNNEVNQSADTHRVSYGHQAFYTVPAIPEDVVIEIATSDSGRLVRGNTFVGIAIPLDSLAENSDYFRDVNDDTAAPVDLTTTFVDFAGVTFEPARADENWLVVASSHVLVNDTGISLESRIRRDGSAAAPVEVGQKVNMEGEDTANEQKTFLVNVFNLSAAEHTLAISLRTDAAGTPSKHSHSTIFVINLTDVFQDHGFVWNAGSFAFDADNVYQDVESIAVTPQTAGPFIILGGMVFPAVAQADEGTSHLTIGGTVNPAGSDQFLSTVDIHDLTDESPSFGATQVTLAASPQTIVLRGKSDGVVRPPATHRILVYFSTELAVAPPESDANWPTYGQVIFNSADEENRPIYGQRIARGAEE